MKSTLHCDSEHFFTKWAVCLLNNDLRRMKKEPLSCGYGLRKTRLSYTGSLAKAGNREAAEALVQFGF